MAYIDELKTLYSDLYKDVNGIRPRPLPEMPEGWYREAIHRLEGDLVEEMQKERERQEVASKEFWNHIKKMMADYHLTMPAAIRWDMMAEGMENDLEHYLWMKDLTWDEIDQCKKSFGHVVEGLR
jgi:hypothetical protein